MTSTITFRRAAVVALALGSILALGGCSSIATLLGGGSAVRDEETSEIVEEGQTSAFDIVVGDCIDDPSASDTATDEQDVSTVAAIPCDQPHDLEVYHDFDVADVDAYPGDFEIQQLAETGCTDNFQAFVGLPYEDSVLLVYYFSPAAESWASGDRKISCLIYQIEDPTDPASPIKQTSGTLKDSKI